MGSGTIVVHLNIRSIDSDRNLSLSFSAFSWTCESVGLECPRVPTPVLFPLEQTPTLASSSVCYLFCATDTVSTPLPLAWVQNCVFLLVQVMNINVRGAMVVAQVGAQSMKSRGVGGSIVNVSSQASMVGLTDHAAYCASKGAMDQLTRVMAVELGPLGIRTNCVNPTVVMTAMGKKGE